VGANCTVSGIEVLAEITVPIDRTLSALNPSELGGVVAVIVSGNPPWSPRSKLREDVEPTVTVPKSRVFGVVASCAGGAAVAVIATPKFPALVSRVATELKV
jgi:hypothetical protein